ncbi:helix-turn-helix transcriptional regulator [Nostoc sp. TCL240-02]|uniref:helix-turn-helix domain-containing protein n=1 Tax=Nostoc sp. TCL240-02 TaxID=2572090 RepID=UPI00157FA18E|nr:helix-turn-helix transcriptional regulator [Nostoc sp. TCL240-02]QKQ75668.1 helix-turn-helix transcriptional regulator [Nostoc sp. TCL240-02]
MMDLNDRDRNPPEIQSLHDFLSFHPMYQHQLAQLMGVTTSAVEKWSRGDRSLTSRTLTQLNTLHERLNHNPELREKYVRTAQCAVC